MPRIQIGTVANCVGCVIGDGAVSVVVNDEVVTIDTGEDDENDH